MNREAAVIDWRCRHPVQGGGWQANTPPTEGDFNQPAPSTPTPTASVVPTLTPTALITSAPPAQPAAAQPTAATAPSWPLWVMCALLALALPLTAWLWRSHLRRTRAADLSTDLWTN